jgi:DNA replication protein DnaC
VYIGEGNLATASCPRYSRDCATGQKVEAIIARRIQREKKQWLDAVDIPEKHRKATKAGILVSAAEILDYLDRWPVTEGHGLVVVGPKGTGKSGTLALVGLEAYARGMAAMDAHFTSLTRLMFALCAKKEEAYWPGRLLLLDELGQAYESDFAFAIFEDYLNWRYERNLTTCVAANLLAEHNPDFPDVGSLEDRKYSRIVDRWRENSDVLVMAGKSRRGQPDTATMQEKRKAGG